MKKIQEEFVPYGIALELRDLGFDYPCVGSYNGTHKFNFTGGYMYKVTPCEPEFCIAPLRQQAFKWLRDKHNYIHVIEDVSVVASDKEGYRFRYHIWKILTHYDEIISDDSPLGYYSYEEAEVKCLIHIIKLIKDKNK
jgi:hypothetical protein